jgi:hypothetical protein
MGLVVLLQCLEALEDSKALHIAGVEGFVVAQPSYLRDHRFTTAI